MEYCEGCENILDNCDPPGRLCISCATNRDKCKVIAYGTKIEFCPLHAAAPALLEACKEMEQLISAHIPDEAHNWCKLARAAITKAESKAPIVNDEGKALVI